MKWRKTEGKIKDGVIYTETGHKITFEPKVDVFVDLDRKEGDLPFFYVEFPFQYKSTDVNGTKNMTIEEIEKMTTQRRIDYYWEQREFDSHF